MGEHRWLDETEARAWRSFIAVSRRLFERLGRELQVEHGLTHTDYEILVRLSETKGHSLRMSVLSDLTQLSKSRLSHQVTRMESAGWVRRAECEEDRRGMSAVLTEAGLRLLEQAAPTHVRGVREHFVDLMSDEDKQALAVLFPRIQAHLEGASGE